MNNIDGLSSHLANLILSLYKISSRNDGDDAIYQSCFPSNTIDPKKLNNQYQIKDQFQTDSIPSANQIQWNVSNVSLSQKFQEVLQEVYQNYEINNNYISEDEIQKVAEEIDDIIYGIDLMNQKVEQYTNNLSPSQDPNSIQRIQKLRQNIEQENKKMIEIIQKNIPAVLKMQQKKIKNQISQTGCLPVNLLPENIIDMLTADQNHQIQNGFQRFSYNSLDIQGQTEFLKDTFIQKLSEKLQGLGIGQKKSQDQLTLSIKDAFQSIQIELEWKRIDFKRDWLNINLLKILLGETELDGKNSNDGINKQDQTSQIIPFVQVAAIVVTPDISIDDNEMIIKMGTPRILGYIIKPIIPIQKEEHEIEYSLTDNSIIIQNLQRKDFQLRDIMWPKKQKIKVRFVGQDTSKQHFINLSNLYRECIQQWIQDKIPLSIDVDENNKYDIYKDYKDDFQLVHVKIDESGQVFTLGIGNTLQKLKYNSDYNQLFGLKEFNLLIKQQNPNNQIINKCRRVILHELGHVIGFIQEFNNFQDQFDQQKVYQSFKKNLEKLQNDSVLRINYDTLENEINKRVQTNIMNRRELSNFEKFDERSIMYQPFPNQWLKNPKQIQPNNHPSMQDFNVLDEHYGIFQTYKPQMFQMNMPQNFPTMNLQTNQIVIDRNLIKELQNDCANDNTQNSNENQKNAQPQFQKRQRLIKPVQQEQISEIQIQSQNQIQKQISEPNNYSQQQISQIQGDQDQRYYYNSENKRKSQIEENQNEYKKTINLEKMNNIKKNEQYDEHKFDKIQEEKKVDISQLSNEYQKDFMATVRIDSYQKSNNTTTKNPQSDQDSTINDDSQSFQSNVSQINIQDAQIVYHPKIELYRDEIIAMLKNGDNQDQIIECYVENLDIIRIQGWQNQMMQLMKEVQSKNSDEKKIVIDQQFLGLKIPYIDEKNKRLLVKILKSQKNIQNNKDLINMKQNVSEQTISTLISYYAKYGAISNQLKDLYQQEINECIDYMKQENFQFAQIKKATLIHEIVLKQIYNIELDKIKAHKDLIEPFLSIKDIKLDQEIVSQMIFQENDLLKKYIISIFKNSYYVYDSLKKYCIKNGIALFIFDNEIEEFIRQIQNDKNFQAQQKQMQLLKDLIRQDQVYCLQLLYYLNKEQIQNDGQNNKKKVEEVDPNATWAIKNKNYFILTVNQNKNIARVINKAFLILTSDDIDSSYNFQFKYEKKRIFENESQQKVSQFLEDFKKYNSSNLPFNEKRR